MHRNSEEKCKLIVVVQKLRLAAWNKAAENGTPKYNSEVRCHEFFQGFATNRELKGS